MTDVEISRRLALAIGYAPKDVRLNLAGKISVHRLESPQGYAVPGWWRFDYRDGETIWPIAERFNAFPLHRSESNEWVALVGFNFKTEAISDTSAKAVALAVIKAHEAKK